ncbi:Uma2 family endonuclease [Luteolibacter flavescens]|uniref:Uma2 family endonuclease n=1 Tax=Luteolibacter flavescens TaxID=1859460 RepID=A0ABT3FL13_9BACT|nr:Uma2 family endonuclease [Luteolibacter flavescens]MCW1884262.1 Uma2 family endonuclease [Luteolibacter flavescens]
MSGNLAYLYPELVSVDDYLEGERHSEAKHEYSGGVVTAMAGASREHELVGGNLFASIHGHLRGKGCRTYKSDMKLHTEVIGADIFYYPDIMVACDPDDDSRYFVRKPKLIIEILSDNIMRDRVEKFLVYQRIPSLEEYVVVSQHPERAEVSIFRRADGWEPGETHRTGEFILRSIGLTLRVEDIYLA